MQRKSSSSVPSQSGVGSSGTIKAAAPATKPPAAGRPRSGNIKSKDAAAVTQAVADLPHIVGSKGDAGGVIHLTGRSRGVLQDHHAAVSVEHCLLGSAGEMMLDSCSS